MHIIMLTHLFWIRGNLMPPKKSSRMTHLSVKLSHCNSFHKHHKNMNNKKEKEKKVFWSTEKFVVLTICHLSTIGTNPMLIFQANGMLKGKHHDWRKVSDEKSLHFIAFSLSLWKRDFSMLKQAWKGKKKWKSSRIDVEICLQHLILWHSFQTRRRKGGTEEGERVRRRGDGVVKGRGSTSRKRHRHEDCEGRKRGRSEKKWRRSCWGCWRCGWR